MRECEYYEELISRLVDSELNKNEYDALWMHIKNCSRCNAMYAVFNAMSDIISDDTAELPEGLHENIMAGVRRSDIVKKNRFKLSRPVRNALAAAACAVFVLFAARGLSPADRAKDVALSGEEAAVMQSTAPAAESAEALPAETAAPEAAAPSPAAVPAPAPASTPAAVNTVPAATVPTRDIYLSDDSPAQSTGSAPSAVHTPAPAPSPVETPLVALTPVTAPPVKAPAAEPAAQAESAEAPAVQSDPPMTVKADPPMTVKSAAPAKNTNSGEGAAVSAETEPPVESPEVSDSPSLLSRGFRALFVSAPAPARSEAPSSEAAAAEEASPTVEAAPSAEPAPVKDDTAVASEAKKDVEEATAKLVLRDKDDMAELLKLLSGTEKKLPDGKADKVFRIVLADEAETAVQDLSAPGVTAAPSVSAAPEVSAAPDASPAPGSVDEDAREEKMYVYFFGKEIYFLSYDKGEAVVCLAKCSAEELEKFIDELDDVSIVPLASPSPSPAESDSHPDSAAPHVSTEPQGVQIFTELAK